MPDPLAPIKRAARRRASADTDLRTAIRAAHADGVTLRKIGDAAGLSHVHVLRIVRGK